MRVTLSELRTSRSKRLKARMLRYCTVILSSEKIIEFDKILRKYSYEGELTAEDEEEIREAIKLLDI